MTMAAWLLLAISTLTALQDWKRVAPYEGLRWNGDAAEVRVDDAWYELAAIDGVTTADLLRAARTRYGGKWEERFAEDIYEVMVGAGHEPGATVSLDLVDLATRAKVHRDGVSMDAAKRRELMRARREANSAARRPTDAAARRPQAPLARADAKADLAHLSAELRGGYSYWFRGGADFERRRAEIEAALPETTTVGRFARDVQELLALLGDGHTQLQDFDEQVPPGWLPFLVEAADGRFVALKPERDGFVDDAHRELVALDGRPLAEWLAAAARFAARGHEEFVRRESMRSLRRLALLREVLGLPAAPKVKVTLAAADGRRRELELDVAERKPVYGIWPRAKTHRLDDGTGYLRIESMEKDPAFLARLGADLNAFANAPGLVIDVRGNGSGSQTALRELLPRLMRVDEPLAIVNVAARRVVAGEPADGPEGSLVDRFLFPATASTWSAEERAGVAAFLAKFRPSVALPARDFTAWHVMGVRAALQVGAKRIAGPVVVLQDGGCFSATDVFLAALHGRSGVTTVGTISGGGSGRAQRLALPRSGLQLRASTMASFRPDGSAYDGVGIAPDVVVAPAAEDLVGRGDAQLDAARRELAKRRR